MISMSQVVVFAVDVDGELLLLHARSDQLSNYGGLACTRRAEERALE